MTKVKNGGTLLLLTRSFMKINRGRNGIAMLAIVLTSLLLTSLFGGCTSLILSERATEIKQSLCSSHASIQNMTEDELARAVSTVKASDGVERYGVGTFLGLLADERIGFQTELRSGDGNLAESFNCPLAEGEMPHRENEIVMSTLVLDAIGIPHRIGERIRLSWESATESKDVITDEFVLTGYYTGDKAVLSQFAWVSEEYAGKHAIRPDREALENGNYGGGKDIVIWFDNTWRLEEKTAELTKKAAFSDESVAFETNSAYQIFGEDGFSLATMGILLLFIMLAGYLIIYNVFSISVRTDIRVYGLLKNVGTTGKQLRKIVRMQALILSMAGIPIGLCLGVAATKIMAPSLAAGSSISANMSDVPQAVVSIPPLMLLAAAAFTLLTVYFSSLQACRMVKRLSPVEALRLSDADRKGKRKGRTVPANWWGMALYNVLRDAGKGFMVMLSMALVLVVVNCIVMLVNGYDLSSYQKITLAADFQLDRMGAIGTQADFTGITPEIKEILDQCPDGRSGYVYYSPQYHAMEDHLFSYMEDYFQANKKDMKKFEKKIWKKAKKSGQIQVHFLGVDESVFNKLEWKGDAPSWEEFSGGNYVLVDYNQFDEEPSSYYKIGENIHMEYENGRKKDYQVAGEALMPYSIDYPYYDCFFITMIVPETEYIAATGNTSAMYATVDAEEGMERKVKEYIDKNVLSEWELLNVSSILDLRESFARYINKYYMIGFMLVLILALIGIMNFFNTVATSIISRRRELALLEAVGMTKKQQKRMLVLEGIIYLSGSFLLAVVIVLAFSEEILSRTLGQAFFFQIQMTVLPCVAMIPVLLIVAWLVPEYQWKKMRRESVVERLV